MKKKEEIAQEIIEEILEDKIETKEINDEDLLFPGGPNIEEIDEWKQEYSKIFFTAITQEDGFVWRTLNRKEFKNIVSENLDPLTKEEKLCELCVLWPANYDYEDSGLAGVASIIAEHIMAESGFNTQSAPIIL